MLQVPLWSRILVALILIGGILVALPNALPDNVRSRLPAWWGNQTISLGLDLQGGSYLLLEVQLDEVQKDKLESLKGDIRRSLRKAHMAITDLAAGPDFVSVRIVEPGTRRRSQDPASDPQSDDQRRPAFGGAARIRANRTVAWPSADAHDRRLSEAGEGRHRQPVDRSRAQAHRRAGNARTLHRTPGRRPHPRPGAGIVGSAAPDRDPQDHRQDDVPARRRDGGPRSRRRKGIVPIGSELLPQKQENARTQASADRRAEARLRGGRPADRRKGGSRPEKRRMRL